MEATMPIIEKSFKQRSPEWFNARLGNLGASSMEDIINCDGKPSKSRMDCLYSLVAEKIRGKADDTFISQAMLDGMKNEQEAIDLFDMLYGGVEQCALVYKDEKKLFHCSPDSLVGLDAGLEVKCPLAKTHVKYLIDNKLPTKYFIQVQSSLYITERKYWWFMSYVSGMPSLIIKVERDEAFITALDKELKLFCAELDELTNKLR